MLRQLIKENITIIIKNNQSRHPDPQIASFSFLFIQDAIKKIGLAECTKIVSEVYKEIEVDSTK
ncbi:MAG: hypothetical protein CBC48_17925 [bacterium TMED88]|nr:MAG: hypothetical protein CBC48_17925 [bacterium TMED88]